MQKSHTVYTLISAVLFSVVLITANQAQANEMAEVERMHAFLDLVDGFYNIIEATHEINDNAEKASILLLHKIRELHEERGELAQVAGIYRSVLERSQNPTIRSTTYFMLGEVLKETGRFEDALKAYQAGLEENLNRN